MFGFLKKSKAKDGAGNFTTARRRLDSYRDDRSSNNESEVLRRKVFTGDFSRNRTITGSKSSLINSANEIDASISSPRAHLHHLKGRRRKLFKYLSFVTVCALASSFLLTVGTYDVDVSLYGQVGAVDRDQKKKYQDQVNEYLNSRPFERIRWLFDKDGAGEYLQRNKVEELDRILGISAGQSLGRSQVVLQMREPVAAWTIGDDKFYVDKEGVIFSINHYAEPDVTIVDESKITVDKSNYRNITSQRFLTFVGLTVSALERNKGIDVDNVIIPSNATRQIDFKIVDGPRLKLTIDRSVGEQVEDGVRVFNYLKREGRTAEYVDVRVSRNAFYK